MSVPTTMPSFRQRLTTDPAAKPDSVDRICAVFKGTGLDPDSERHLHLFGRVNVGGDLPLKGLTLLERTLFRSAVAGDDLACVLRLVRPVRKVCYSASAALQA